MAYLVGSALGLAANAAEHAVANQIYDSRIRVEAALWHSPLARLGRCGIFSLRARMAVERTLDAVLEASASRWYVVNGARLGGGVERIVALAGGRAAVIEAIVGKDYPAAVRRADEGAWAVATRTSQDFPVSAIVCRTDTDEEPRDLPGPSGNTVTVTGLPWLSGLLRSRLGYAPDLVHPSQLSSLLEEADWRASQQHELCVAATRALPLESWWVIEDLHLDDGAGETIDLVLAGPEGVFIVDFVSGGVDEQSSARARAKARRLGRYLPHADVLPLVVGQDVTETHFGERGANGHPVVWLKAADVLGFVQAFHGRGLSPADIGLLNGPGRGWYRRIGFNPDGTIARAIGWRA